VQFTMIQNPCIPIVHTFILPLLFPVSVAPSNLGLFSGSFQSDFHHSNQIYPSSLFIHGSKHCLSHITFMTLHVALLQ
jgi:hypothetical protein